MKYAYQMMIIGGISFAGELLNRLLPLPVPASVYGMLLLLLCLCLGWIKLSQIQETADFLLAIMPLVFVAPGVALMESFTEMKDSLLGIVVISLASTIVVMVLCGAIAQAMVRRKKKKGEEKHE
jgi:holin-like protein